MRSPSIKQPPIGGVFALIVIGLGIGWLAGLSVSPVVSIVITSVTGSVAAIVAVLSGVKEELLDRETSPNTVRRWLNGVSPVPLAWLMVGLILGASGGIMVRTHNWLSPPPSVVNLSEEVAQWVSLGLPADEVARRLFENRVPITNSFAASTALASAEPTYKASVLFATASSDECIQWMNLITKQNYEQLNLEVSSSAVKPFRELPMIVTDTVKLAEIVENVLCADPQP